MGCCAGLVLTIPLIAQLPAHHCCILLVPEVVAHGAPVIVPAHLHSSLRWVPTIGQLDGSIGTAGIGDYIAEAEELRVR